MLVCMNCNVEYEEDRRFCKHCGNPLVPKIEPISTQKKVNRTKEEKSDGTLMCPHCKLIYEFGSSCIQCGSPLGRQIPPRAKEEPEIAHRPQVEENPHQEETSQKQRTETPLKNLICPVCKIIYEQGNSCGKCGSVLVAQIPIEAKQEPKIARSLEGEGKFLQAQTHQEKLAEVPHKNLICPDCKIIYERGNSCIKCGSALVTQIPAQEEKKPELSEETQMKKEELEVAPTPEEEVKEEHPQTQIPGQELTKKRGEDLERKLRLPRKRKRDYRRLFLEAGSISIMALAGGYFLWSVYSHLITKRPEPKTSTFKEVHSPVLSNSSISANITATVSMPKETENREMEQSSAIPNEKTEVVPPAASNPTSSDFAVSETQEIRKIKSLLENIRQANLQKNIDLFISCYAADFKDREGKKKTTLAYWKKFDYLNLSFDLKRPSISVDTAKTRVEWLIKISSKTGGQPQESKTILDVILKKEEGGWKIKEVKQGG